VDLISGKHLEWGIVPTNLLTQQGGLVMWSFSATNGILGVHSNASTLMGAKIWTYQDEIF
jgi:hypothetical protein